MKASVAAPASSSVTVEARMASSKPERVCIPTTKGSICVEHVVGLVDDEVRAFGQDLRSSSVMSVAISTMTSTDGSRPVISRSIQTSTSPP